MKLALPFAVLAFLAAAVPSAHAASPFSTVGGTPAKTHNGAAAEVRPTAFHAFTVDHTALGAELEGDEVALPGPDGELQRFTLVESPVMEPVLAAQHPELRTYIGHGIDDPSASLALDLTPLGLHASVLSDHGAWEIDPYYKGSRSLYVSYLRRDARASAARAPFEEEAVEQPAIDLPRAAPRVAAVVLRTYRIALVNDPTYATYFGTGNVLAAKATLINRLSQIYRDDLAVQFVLADGTDALNLDTTAKFTGANGPCGTTPCFDTAAAVAGCPEEALARNQFVLGQLLGASAYDIGHFVSGGGGGGLASLGIVGRQFKGQGCTSLSAPTGDGFAVDYVAHEVGHQFGAEHTFNGTLGSCAGNRAAPVSVEPGGGSSVMAYAGICLNDDLQPHSDPYFSQSSIATIDGYVASSLGSTTETQDVSLRNFSGTDSFSLSWGGQTTAVITRGTNYTAAAIDNALTAVLPGGSAVDVTGLAGETFNDEGFRVRFAVPGVADPAMLTLPFTSGVTAQVGETDEGGPVTNGGTATDAGNASPVVTAASSFTIPLRTPFTLTGAGTDADGDTLSYSWEQNDRGGATATNLFSNTKPNGPLFRQFSGIGPNVAPATPTRTFPDITQLLADDTNAATGTCPAADVDCFSEFLPTSDWVGILSNRTLSFRLTARDRHTGGGGTGSADTTLTLVNGTGPFRVTAPTAATYAAGDPLLVTWDVAGTANPPISATNVKLTLSTDGGVTYPTVLAETTPNDGSQTVTVPAVRGSSARVKVEAVGNVFFDVSHAVVGVTGPAFTTSAATVQYSDPLSVPLSADDADSDGGTLDVNFAGLPAGLALTAGATSGGAVRPGTRAWTLSGNVTGAVATYAATATVTDGDGHGAPRALPITVTPESATAAYTGALTSVGTSVALAANVAEPADGAPGDLSTASITFREGATTLCTAAANASGNGTCVAPLASGTHAIDVVVGGNYTGATSATVSVTAPAVTPTPTPTATPVAFGPLRPVLTKIAARPKASKSGALSLTLSCVSAGRGALPARCVGTLTLVAKLGGRNRTIGSAKFDVTRAGGKVTVKLTSAARALLRKRSLKATLAVTVTNRGTGAAAKATRKLVLQRVR